MSSALCTAVIQAKEYCTLPGPLLPKPTGLATAPSIADASSKLEGLFDHVVNGSLPVAFDPHDISFTIGLVSLSDSKPLWEYHHLAPTNVNGMRYPNGDSEWMIGSISKVFTDLILLKLELNINDPVTKFLPQLASGDSETDWDSITLASLANHLSGLRMNYGYPEIYEVVPYFEALGFPPLGPSEFPLCGIAGLNRGCNSTQLLEGLKRSHLVLSPNDRPSYSSISFTVLSYALQAATGRNYTRLLRDEVLVPLNLTHTGELPGNDSNAVIPAVQPNSWGVDYGDNAPGGGLHSSLNDLCRLAHAILTRTVLPNPTDVRKWLQPTGFAGPTNALVGSPWEIFRTTDLLANHQNVDVHAKDGGALAYVARVALLDSYGIGLVAFTAGGKGNEALNPIVEAALAVFAPAVDEAARAEARVYAGMYQSRDGVDATLVVEIDEGPGLKVRELSRNGTDILASIQTIWELQPVSPGKLNTDFRMYPMEITRKANLVRDGGEVDVVEEDWRMLITPDVSGVGNNSMLPRAGTGFWKSQCAAWQSVDTLYYGGEPIDRFVVDRDAVDGTVLGIRSPALRLDLWKDSR